MDGETRCLLLLLLQLFGFITSSLGQNLTCPFPDGDYVNVSQEKCGRYPACIWTSSDSSCMLRTNIEIGYVVSSTPEPTPKGFTLQLTRISSAPTLFAGDIENLVFEVINHENYHIQIKITDADKDRYEVPVPLDLPENAGLDPLYRINTSNLGDPFRFSILRRSNNNVLYDMIGPLIYEDQFIQISTHLSSEYLYGFGESCHTTFKRGSDEICAVFARDQGIKEELTNVYGHHPYYMVMEDDFGNSHSLLYYTSNALDYNTFMDGSTNALTLRSIGGIVDMHFFLGPMPEDVNVQYINMIGNPVFPPYFMLGFQLSRWGYRDLDHIKQVHDAMVAAGIPYEIQTFDVDYMDTYKDFTYDTVDFAGLPEFIDQLHSEGRKATIILDPAIAEDWVTYDSAIRGRDQDVYIRWADPAYIPSNQDPGSLDYLVGKVWPGRTLFPDFMKPETVRWWIDEMILFYETLKYDIMWVDMNEPACFETDSADQTELQCPYTDLDSPPYPTATTFTGASSSGRISDHSICMSSMHTNGTTNYTHYDTHSLYGFYHVKATYEGMVELFPGKRHAVLVRSTFPSSGKYGVHWLGDNGSIWPHMAMSLIGMMEFSMFGIAYTGADVCGFIGDTTEEMCGRWTALGAFYPFNRNHNHESSIDQHPSQWESVTAIAIKYYNLRSKYNPYLYTLFYNANLYGSTIVRPLLNNYPTDLVARDIDDQFMWADGLMIAPILASNTSTRDIYFPEGIWYDLLTGTLDAVGSTTLTDVPVPIDDIRVYLLGGKILPYQEPEVTTTLSRLNPFGMTIALDATGSAGGELFWDDGESDVVIEESYLATMIFESNVFVMTISNDPASVEGLNLETLDFFGYASDPSSITVNSVDLPSGNWTYNDISQVLTVSIVVPMSNNLTVTLTS